MATKEKTYAEIINPSDKYTIDITDKMAACAAVIYLGEGQYALRGEDDEQVMPLFMFGGFEPWWNENFPDEPFDEDFPKRCGLRVAAALDTLVIGNRDEYDVALSFIPLDDHAAFRRIWQDKKRTSMNDIGSHGEKFAKRLRELCAETTSG